MRVGILSLSRSSSSSTAVGACGVFGDSWIEAFPEERDDNELRFFSDDEAEFKCLFFRSVVGTTMVEVVYVITLFLEASD